jgi:hypothetical protein
MVEFAKGKNDLANHKMAEACRIGQLRAGVGGWLAQTLLGRGRAWLARSVDRLVGLGSTHGWLGQLTGWLA